MNDEEYEKFLNALVAEGYLSLEIVDGETYFTNIKRKELQEAFPEFLEAIDRAHAEEVARTVWGLVEDGLATATFDEELGEYVFSLTEKGSKAVNEVAKATADDKA